LLIVLLSFHDFLRIFGVFPFFRSTPQLLRMLPTTCFKDPTRTEAYIMVFGLIAVQVWQITHQPMANWTCCPKFSEFSAPENW
jgi:hypothetical protein